MAQAAIVSKAAGEASKALSGDIVRIDTQYFRTQTIGKGKGKREILVPINIEAHVNPAGLLMAGAVGLVGALAGVIAWNGISVPGPLGGEIVLLKGLKDTGLGEDLNARYQAARQDRIDRRTKAGIYATDPTTRVDEFSCEDLKAKAGRSYSAGRISEGDFWRDIARLQGCEWAAGPSP